MFTDHVGAVSVYLFDANGHYLEQRTVQNTAAAQPLKSKDFCVHFDIAPGTYQYQAVAFQRPYAECQATAGARFKGAAPQSASDNLQTLRIALPAKPVSGVADTMMVDNAALPLDTLWAPSRCATTTSLPHRPTPAHWCATQSRLTSRCATLTIRPASM